MAASRRRVFYLVDSFEIGGTETQAVELALRMSQAGHTVTMGALQAKGPLLDRLRGSEVAVEQFYPRGGLDSPHGLLEVLRLGRYLRRHRFDVVHSHDLWSNLMGVVAAKLARVPAIVCSQRDLSHDAWYQGARRAWLRRIQKWSDAVLVNSGAIGDDLVSQDGFNPSKIRVIHNGVDVARFRGDRGLQRALFPGLEACKFIVLVGNMHTDVKGQDLLIAAAPAVLREFPETRFVLVGDGAQRHAFEKMATETGVKNEFLFLGRRANVAEILAGCDLAVLPSRAEGFPNAVLEYLAAGLPTIATQVGGMPELIEDNVTGMLVPPEDSSALSSAILSLLRAPETARRIAVHGHESALQKFSFERMTGEVEALYTELLLPAKQARR
jgi:glycosyltransferase involved in cell wall biosynthesis